MDWSSTAERIEHYVALLPPKVRRDIAADRVGAVERHVPRLLRQARAPDQLAYRACAAVLAGCADGKPMGLGEGLALALGPVMNGNGAPGRRATRLEVMCGNALRQPRYLASRCQAERVKLPPRPLLRFLLGLSEGDLSPACRRELSEAYTHLRKQLRPKNPRDGGGDARASL